MERSVMCESVCVWIKLSSVCATPVYNLHSSTNAEREEMVVKVAGGAFSFQQWFPWCCTVTPWDPWTHRTLTQARCLPSTLGRATRARGLVDCLFKQGQYRRMHKPTRTHLETFTVYSMRAVYGLAGLIPTQFLLCLFRGLPPFLFLSCSSLCSSHIFRSRYLTLPQAQLKHTRAQRPYIKYSLWARQHELRPVQTQ